MANSIRTPKRGVSARSRRIAEAVDDEGWQEVRLSMKGLPTAEKLDTLEEYWKTERHNHHDLFFGDLMHPIDLDNCDVCIRIDNYIKALIRGGQLVPFIDLSYIKHVGGRDHKWRDTRTNGNMKIIRKWK